MTQRTDKELLELAAKAAGINAHYVNASFPYMTYAQGSAGSYRKVVWNPLTDDGDALRLAVKLNALVDINNGKTACVLPGPETDSVQHDSDPYEATRRAIVRAAAEIGAKL
jgi:hypothetical protein